MPQDEKPKTGRPIGTLSIDVKTVYDRLVQCSVGDVVHYQDLSAMIGRDIHNRANWVLQSARRRALTQNRMLFGAVAKVGVQRLSDPQIVDTCKDALSRVHHAALRAGRKLTAVQNFESMPAEKKLQHNTYVSALAILAHVTKERELKKLESHVQKAQVALPLQKTLEAFRE